MRGSTHLLVPLLTKKPHTLIDQPLDKLGAPRQVVAAGGGAHKFKDLFLSSMHIELVALKEFQSLIDGLRFLHEHHPPNELYTVVETKDDSSMTAPSISKETIIDEWPVPLYPFLLVSFGSGVSILQVNSAAESDYERVGGTATGGATFLGLMNLLSLPHTDVPLSFDEIVALAAQGDPSKVDKLVGDIYGEDGCANLGLPPTMTAANFGKLASETQHSDTPDSQQLNIDPGLSKRNSSASLADIAAATLQMISQASAVLVRTIAQQAKCLTRVFVVGGFMDSNPIARRVFAKNVAALKGRAIFLKHSGYLGSLGSLQHCFCKGGTARHLDPLFYGWDLGVLGANNNVNNVKASPVRQITCPTHIVQRRASNPNSTTNSPILTPVVETPQLSPTTLMNSTNWFQGENNTIKEEDDERLSDMSRTSDLSRGVSNSSVNEINAHSPNVMPFPSMPASFNSISPLNSPNLNASAASSPPTTTSFPSLSLHPMPSPPDVSDANYWWQFGLIWAFAASFSMVRNDVKLEALLVKHGIISEHVPSPNVDHSDDHNGGGGGGQSSSSSMSGCGDWRFGESIRCLDKCIQLEPRCAMAFWALSWIHGHRKLDVNVTQHTSSSAQDTVNTEEGNDDDEDAESRLILRHELSMESAHFASRRAVGLLRAGKFTKNEEALIETNGLRFALWPPCEYANYLSLSYAAAMRSAANQFSCDPEIVTVMVRSKLDVLDSTEVLNNFTTSEEKAKMENCEVERKLLEMVQTALVHHSCHIGLLIAKYSLLGRICIQELEGKGEVSSLSLNQIRETVEMLSSLSPDTPMIYMSSSQSWEKFGSTRSDSMNLSPMNSPTSRDSSERESIGGRAAMGRLRGISYGVIDN